MTTLVVFGIFFLILNSFYAVWMYRQGNYKTAMFNAFASGCLACALYNYFLIVNGLT